METFAPALERLAALSDRLALVGSSKGAEAALLLAAADRRITAVAALAPTSVVWQAVAEHGEGERARSSFTHRGRALAFVPYHRAWAPDPGARAPAYRGLYETSMSAGAQRVAAARIKVEATTTLSHPQAGHRITFPGEEHPTGGMTMARGGTAAADAELGAATWAALTQMLDLT